MERKSVNYVLGMQMMKVWVWHYLCIVDAKSGTFEFPKFPGTFGNELIFTTKLFYDSWSVTRLALKRKDPEKRSEE